MASRRGKEDSDGKQGGATSPRERWVPMRDDDVRRRERELQQVSSFVKTVHQNGETGLMKAIGPSLGVSGDYCVLGLEGDVLGNASAVAPPPHHRDVRVLNIAPSLQRKVGQPDFEKIEFGLTGLGGEVYGAEFQPPTLRELKYPTHVPNSRPPEEHPRSGQVKTIGRVALQEPDKEQVSRILVMGGQRKSRDDLIRWYCGVRRFVHGTERDAIEESLAKLKKKAAGSQGGASMKSSEDDKAAGTNSSQASTETRSLKQLEEAIEHMDEKFHVISTWYDKQREAAYLALARELANKQKELEGADKPNEAESQVDDDESEFAREEHKKRLGDEIKELHQELARFRHVQGSHTPLVKLIDAQQLGPQWSKLEKQQALALLYHGAAGRSTMRDGTGRSFGTIRDFSKLASHKVRSFRPGQDFMTYLEGEVLLSVGDPKDAKAAPWPPDNLIFINSPDIVNDIGNEEGNSESLSSISMSSGGSLSNISM